MKGFDKKITLVFKGEIFCRRTMYDTNPFKKQSV